MNKEIKYDFDTTINRRKTDSIKWDVKEEELPMWVADMDFQTAPEILSAIQDRAKRGIFGYCFIPPMWQDAIIKWWKERHELEIKKEWLIFCTGVLPAISSAVRKFTTIGENIVVQTPVYNMFFNSIVNNGRHILESPLKYQDGIYEMDFEDLEQKLSDPQTTMMILCNPHNPVGKIWDKEILERIGELCWKYHVVVLSDEIHCDLTDPCESYVPFASVSEKCRQNSISCIAPTKTFNLAGLQTAAVIVPNENLFHKMNRALNTDEVAEPNAFAVDAATVAFTKGGIWLDQLREYIKQNKECAKKFLEDELPQLKLVPSKATYLLWIDCRKLGGQLKELPDIIRKTSGLYLSGGNQYGADGYNFLRMNIACPRSILNDGLERLKKGILAYESQH